MELQSDVHDFLLGGLHLPRKAFAAGDVIMREGDTGDAAYMIVSGTLPRVPQRRRSGGNARQRWSPATSSARWRSCSTSRARPASMAVEPVTLLVLDKATMTEGLGLEGWTGALVRALAQRFRDLEQQRTKLGDEARLEGALSFARRLS